LRIPPDSSCRRIDVVRRVVTPAPLLADRGCPDQQGTKQGNNWDQEEQLPCLASACRGLETAAAAALAAIR
jgi:hypothetical protein